MDTPRNKLICLTPVKNEAWILDQFLTCASRWADHIILADNMSDDDTRAIARKYRKVTLITNPAIAYNESERQQLLLNEGRKIEGPKVFFTLDADEFLTANYESSPEWAQICHAKPGTVFRFNWVNVLPGFQRGWITGNHPWALADDGTAHKGKTIHSPRIPLPENSPTLALSDIKVLHYQYTDWARMRSKHGWYLCYECLHSPEKRMVKLYRQYHHMVPYLKRRSLTTALDPQWFESYEQNGIPMKVVRHEPYWWDREVILLLIEHGPQHFAQAAIWDRDWNALKAELAPEATTDLSDPRSLTQKWIQAYLKLTQPYARAGLVKYIDQLLQLLTY